MYREIAIHFVSCFRPSVHQGFASGEHEMQITYEAAEINGRQGLNCEEIYFACFVSLLDFISLIEY